MDNIAPIICDEPELPNWYYAKEKKKVGPLKFGELRERVACGELSQNDMVWQTGTQFWREVKSINGLSSPLPDPDEYARLGSFVSDLQVVYQSVAILDPQACLPTLGLRFDKRRQFLEHFRTELEQVFERNDPSPKKFLNALASRFAICRAAVKAELEASLAQLPVHDPLHCSISLFGTMDHGRLERAHTKVLAWLLDPNNEDHDMGSHLLTAILRRIDADLADRVDLQSIVAESEKVIDGNDRLDVFVAGKIRDEAGNLKKWCLVIEAKIDAPEDPEQLVRYDRWVDYEFQPDVTTRVYLTPHLGDDAAQEIPPVWKRVRFLEFAGVFRTEMEKLREKEGYHFLRYYLTGILKDIYHWKLPIGDIKDCIDPYSISSYLHAVNGK